MQASYQQQDQQLRAQIDALSDSLAIAQQETSNARGDSQQIIEHLQKQNEVISNELMETLNSAEADRVQASREMKALREDLDILSQNARGPGGYTTPPVRQEASVPMSFDMAADDDLEPPPQPTFEPARPNANERAHPFLRPTVPSPMPNAGIPQAHSSANIRQPNLGAADFEAQNDEFWE